MSIAQTSAHTVAVGAVLHAPWGRLHVAFSIRTIRDLAENKHVLRAQAIVNLSR
jgi:hypothetical protein